MENKTEVSSSFDLDRFVRAQDQMLDQICTELKAGRKRTHWMWFVFPQLIGLGSSEMSRRYAISSAAEARAYVGHDVLGDRLLRWTRCVNATKGLSALGIFGDPDHLKFQSSMTLFNLACPNEDAFPDALKKYFEGEFDPVTVNKLREIEASDRT
jgi:uncharacterized protein (DUF1810 family)